jgi:uncharacterized membrane protein YfcA
MIALSAFSWILAAFSALMVGVSKAGIPGLGTLFIPLFAFVLPARESTGAILPLLIVGDVFAVAFYRRHASWHHLVRLLPWTGAGIVVGFLVMGGLNDRMLRPVIGGIVIVMLALNVWRSLFRKDALVPDRPWLSALTGLVAGATTMVANAAGPVMMLYLLTMRLPKNEFLGTSAWFFLIVNLVKVPFSAALGLITPSSLVLDGILAPAVIAGSFIGVLSARHIPPRAFELSMQALTLAAAVLLFF